MRNIQKNNHTNKKEKFISSVGKKSEKVSTKTTTHNSHRGSATTPTRENSRNVEHRYEKTNRNKFSQHSDASNFATDKPVRKIITKSTSDTFNAKKISTRVGIKSDKKSIDYNPRTRSSDYDAHAKYSKKKQLAYRKATIDPNKPIRLNKFLADAGLCSRREADTYIAAGVVSINGKVATELGTKVLLTDKVMFHNQPITAEKKVYLLLNKPKDCITTLEDTHSRTTVLDLVKNACRERIYPVGRLDRNTTGVLLLTNDGELAAKLTHPKYNKKKIYHAVLDKALAKKDGNAILAGVTLDDGEIVIPDSLEFVKSGSLTEVGIEIHSGQNRVVHRIFEQLGYKIERLDRVYFAGLTKKNLSRGKYRFLTEREVQMLKMGAYE